MIMWKVLKWVIIDDTVELSKEGCRVTSVGKNDRRGAGRNDGRGVSSTLGCQVVS